MKRRAGSVVHTQTGNITVISRLFMVRGGTLKITPSFSLPTAWRNSLFLIAVRYSQIRSRCQFHCNGATGSRVGQACSTKDLRVPSYVGRPASSGCTSFWSLWISAGPSARMVSTAGVLGLLDFMDRIENEQSQHLNTEERSKQRKLEIAQGEQGSVEFLA